MINAVKEKKAVSKDIFNLVEDIRWLSVYFNKFVLNYCRKDDNREADIVVKNAHL